jgi:putative ABC transport system ATP-binding protein
VTRPAVRVEHVTKTYRMGRVVVPALRDIVLEIPEHAVVCIMGKSGSGKSTLLRQLGLLDSPDEGRIYIGDQEVTTLSSRQRTIMRLASLGYVFQEYALLPELTAQENVCLPGLMLGMRGKQCRRRASELLDAVGLGGRLAHRPRELSGGEQQRVAIARALVNEPRVVFADEPTANLDSLSARTVMETIRELNETQGITVLFVSHDPDDKKYATRLVHLRDGEISEEG